MAKPIKNKWFNDAYRQMYGSLSEDGQDAFLENNFATESGVDGMGPVIPSNLDVALAQQNGNATLSQFAKMALASAREHPFKTMGLGALGAGNVGGLMDNDKFGGQLGGLALGGLGASAFASGNPYGQALLTLGGGELGALFDKLRAKREQQRGQMQQQQMPRR